MSIKGDYSTGCVEHGLQFTKSGWQAGIPFSSYFSRSRDRQLSCEPINSETEATESRDWREDM